MRKFKDYFLILASAVLLVLPYHFGGCWPLAFIALIPYLFTIRPGATSAAFLRSYIFGILFFSLLGYWLNYVNVFGFVLLALYLALYFAVFGYFVSAFLSPEENAQTEKNYSPQILRAVVYVSASWVALEYVRGWMIGGLPWGLAAYSQWKNLPLIQISDIFGVYGVSFYVIFVNLLLFKLLKLKFSKKEDLPACLAEEGPRRRHQTSLLGALLLSAVLVTGYGFYSLNSWHRFEDLQDPNKPGLRIALIQGNIPQDQKWNARIKNIIFEKYKRLTLMSAVEKSDLIVWPETAFPGYIEDEPVMAAQLRNMVRQGRTYVLVGAPAFGDLEEGLKFYNSAILFNPQGEEEKRYNKTHLVPFGEYVPLEPVIGFIRRFVDIGHFTAGKEKTLFSIKSRYQTKTVNAKFAALICYEDIFPGLVREFCLKGADFLVNMTNDAWFGKTAAPYQHAQASVFRAVENRVPVVRATNTGLSCFISQTGRITATVNEKGEEIMVTGHRSEQVYLKKCRTLYTVTGDFFAGLCFVLVWLAYRERSKRSRYARF